MSRDESQGGPTETTEGTTVTETMMSETTTDLALVSVRHDTELLVCVEGSLDGHTKDLLVGCCRSWAADGVRNLVIDLSDLSEVDGFGVAALLRCRRVMRARAGSLRVVNVPGETAQTFLRTGMYEADGATWGQRSSEVASSEVGASSA
jgi:anti-anti-sigma factor